MAKFRVKELAQERGLTTEALARESGVKFSTVRNIWQGRVEDPNYSTLSAIARALNVRIEDLEDRSETAEKNEAPGRSVAYAIA
jgi:transcriptional regulator with XRE-family HTH domain